MTEGRDSPPRQGSIIALTAYPLSKDFRARLEARLGRVPDYHTLAELRQSSLFGMLRRLAGMKADRLLLPLEDPGARGILSLLAVLASLTRARRIEIVDLDLVFTPCGRHRAVGWLLAAGWASIQGLTAAFLCHLELKRLGAKPRLALRQGPGDVVYLKTNLWRGVKAGGSVGHVAGVVNALIRGGLRVLFLGAERPIMVDDSVDFQPVDFPSAFGLPRDVNQYLFHRRFYRRALEITPPDGVGFFYQRLSVANYVGVLLARRMRVPLVVEYNGSEVWVAKNWGYPLRFPGLAEMAETACLDHAELIVTVSDVLRDELLGRGIERDRIVTYPNCIDPTVFDPDRFSGEERGALRAEYGLAADDVVVTFIGTFGQWHGVEVFASSIAQLVEDRSDWLERHRVRFLIVGDGLKRSEVDSILGRPAYGRYFHMPGLIPQDQAALHLAASDILVSPHVRNPDGTRFFGSPTKLFEYMAMGRAIVASDLDQIGEVFRGCPRAGQLAGAAEISGDHAAILVEPGDAAELAAAIELLVEHPEWRRRLGERARQTALARYTWDHHVGAILAALRRRAERPAGSV